MLTYGKIGETEQGGDGIVKYQKEKGRQVKIEREKGLFNIWKDRRLKEMEESLIDVRNEKSRIGKREGADKWRWRMVLLTYGA